MTTVTSPKAPRRSVPRTAAPAVDPRPWWVDVLTGHAKAIVGLIATFCFTLGSSAVNGPIDLAQVLIAIGAALGVGGSVSRVANTGPRAPAAA